MQTALALLKEQGAKIVELDSILPEGTGDLSFQVLLYEFKAGLNNYFMNLGKDAPVNSLEELIAKTLEDSVETRYNRFELLKLAQTKGGLNTGEYKKALAEASRMSREQGIDHVMEVHNLDAIIAPTGGPAWKTDPTNGDSFHISSSSPAAIAGYPNITVPMGQIDGLPVGLSIFGKAWSEPQLLTIAYSYEQASKKRITPSDL